MDPFFVVIGSVAIAGICALVVFLVLIDVFLTRFRGR